MTPDAARQPILAPEMDRVLSTLSDRRRRLLLLALACDEGRTASDMIARGKSDAEDLEVELVHTHLPRLEEEGYIEWDRESGEISKGPRFEEIEPLLELIERHADELPPDWP